MAHEVATSDTLDDSALGHHVLANVGWPSLELLRRLPVILFRILQVSETGISHHFVLGLGWRVSACGGVVVLIFGARQIVIVWYRRDSPSRFVKGQSSSLALVSRQVSQSAPGEAR